MTDPRRILPTPRAGAKIRETAEAVGSDLGDVVAVLRDAVAFLAELEESLGGLKKAPRCLKWRLDLDQIAGEIEDDALDATEKLLGSAPREKPETTVDHEHLGRVRAAKTLPAVDGTITPLAGTVS